MDAAGGLSANWRCPFEKVGTVMARISLFGRSVRYLASSYINGILLYFG